MMVKLQEINTYCTSFCSREVNCKHSVPLQLQVPLLDTKTATSTPYHHWV